jgi:hypothetical protein
MYAARQAAKRQEQREWSWRFQTDPAPRRSTVQLQALNQRSLSGPLRIRTEKRPCSSPSGTETLLAVTVAIPAPTGLPGLPSGMTTNANLPGKRGAYALR